MFMARSDQASIVGAVAVTRVSTAIMGLPMWPLQCKPANRC